MTDNTNGNHEEPVRASKEWTWSAGYEDRMMNLLESGFKSDWTLIVGPQKEEMKVHKLLLEAASPKFNSILNISDFEILSAEKEEFIQNWRGSKTSILNVNPKIFKLFLKYVYTGVSGAKIQDALPLLRIATDYAVEELIDECATLLKGDLTDENVIPLFQEAMECAHTELIESSLQFICRNARRIVHLEEFKNLRLECLIEIVKQDELGVRNELEIFTSIMRWAEAECIRQNLDSAKNEDLRKVLNKVLAYIRFPNMNQSEFSLNVATTNILGMEELVSLLLCFAVPVENRVSIRSGRFISTPRKYYNPAQGPMFFVNRGDFPSRCRKPSAQTMFPLREKLRVTVDKPVLLAGLKCLIKVFCTDDPVSVTKATPLSARNSAVVRESSFSSLTTPEYDFDYSWIRVHLKIKNILDLDKRVLVVEENKKLINNTDIALNHPLQLQPNGVYQLEVELNGSIQYRAKNTAGSFNFSELTNERFKTYAGENYKNTKKIICKNEGDEKIICFGFERKRGDTSFPINKGYIEELIFYVP